MIAITAAVWGGVVGGVLVFVTITALVLIRALHLIDISRMANSESPQPATPEKPVVNAIEAYVCPNCGSSYSSSSVPNLALTQNIRSAMRNLAGEEPSEWGKPTGSRIECQFCKAKGVTVEREKTVFVRLDYLIDVMAKAMERQKT